MEISSKEILSEKKKKKKEEEEEEEREREKKKKFWTPLNHIILQKNKTEIITCLQLALGKYIFLPPRK
jgi:hypothetical protein